MFELCDDSSTSGQSSDELILLALQGDEEAFTVLYRRYTPELSRYIGGLMHTPEDRDEVVAEAFVKAWQALPQLQSFERFRPWLYRIATHIAYDHYRKEKNRRWLPLDASGEDVVNPLCFERAIEEAELVKLALQEVPWRYRTCLLLSVEGKYSTQEIAEVVKISVKSVPTYISLGREYLRKAYRRLTQTEEKEH